MILGSVKSRSSEENNRDRDETQDFKKWQEEISGIRNRKKQCLVTFRTLSQIRRLRKGFEDLQNGLAANANLRKYSI